MIHFADTITAYDKKRSKVILDEGEMAFLLYNGEIRRLHLSPGAEVDEKTYDAIMQILNERAKKRVLYYLKGSDKTTAQIRTKLRQGLYPEQVIEEALQFLAKYKLVDDSRYAADYIQQHAGRSSKREIQQKLAQKGIRGAEVSEQLESISKETDEAAAVHALRGKYPPSKRDLLADEKEQQRAYGYLLRKGFSYEAAGYALRHIDEED